jgi:hypothetical protein
VIGLVLVAVRRARARTDREIAALVATVLGGEPRGGPSTGAGGPAGDGAPAVDAADALDGLPAPIRRYLSHVLPATVPPVRAVRLEQRGGLRLGDASSPWRPLTATEHAALDPPGFVWDATVELAPLASVRVVDAFVAGRGLLRARLGGVVAVADATPGPALDAGELARYLAEAPLYPTVLLSDAVAWEPIDDRSARATLSSGETTVSCVFHVDDADEVTRVTATRPRLTADGDYEPTPWTGHWRRYRVRGEDGDGDGDGDGVLVPTEGEVRWNLPDGALPYWRARVDVTPIDDAPSLPTSAAGRRQIGDE